MVDEEVAAAAGGEVTTTVIGVEAVRVSWEASESEPEALTGSGEERLGSPGLTSEVVMFRETEPLLAAEPGVKAAISLCCWMPEAAGDVELKAVGTAAGLASRSSMRS